MLARYVRNKSSSAGWRRQREAPFGRGAAWQARRLPWLLMTSLAVLLLSACASPQVTQALIAVTLFADGSTYRIELPAGSTVQQAFDKAGVLLTELDRSEPPLFTLLSDGAVIRLIRVREEFEVEKVIIPFERQIIQNETLPVGETRLSQPGENGVREITYRRLFENDQEISRTEVKSVTIKEPAPEIWMVGSQALFTSLPIPGRLAYLSAGNAWVMQSSTGERKAVVTTGDLDGRIFSLSPDRRWLLFTRDLKQEGVINTLWAARVDTEKTTLVDLKAANVVHFAQWSPDSKQVAYSTVEPREAAPGWQANNDLQLVRVSPGGLLAPTTTLVETNAGGFYGWWGTDYAWSPAGDRLLYARPDGIGFYDFEAESLTPFYNLLPFRTGSNWAWTPGSSWAPNGGMLYLVDHVAPPGAPDAEASQSFDLVALPLEGAKVTLVSRVGMFAYPVVSPLLTEPPAPGDFMVAYLQSLSPEQSENSRYRLAVMDRDGSNRQLLFPAEGVAGLEPQRVAWSPAPLEDEGYVIALVYQGNIWLVSVQDGTAQQITGDNLTVRIDWR